MSINPIIDTRLAQLLPLIERTTDPADRQRLEAEYDRLVQRLYVEDQPVKAQAPAPKPTPRPIVQAPAPKPKPAVPAPVEEDDRDFHLTRKYAEPKPERFSDEWGKRRFQALREKKWDRIRARIALAEWEKRNPNVIIRRLSGQLNPYMGGDVFETN